MQQQTHQALISNYIFSKGNPISLNLLSVLGGVVLLSLLAQITLVLPFTPVPITGQTFGVTLIALTWGQKRGSLVVLSYLVLGALGFPLFATGLSGLFGSTSGYLMGMLVGAFIMGYLSDKGWCKTFKSTLLVSYLGSLCVFSCGLFVLSFFIPRESLLIAGLYPFLIGDFLKNFLAVSLTLNLTHHQSVLDLK